MADKLRTRIQELSRGLVPREYGARNLSTVDKSVWRAVGKKIDALQTVPGISFCISFSLSVDLYTSSSGSSDSTSSSDSDSDDTMSESSADGVCRCRKCKIKVRKRMAKRDQGVIGSGKRETI